MQSAEFASLPAVVVDALGALCPDDPACPPGDVPPRRWRQFLADVHDFLASGFAAQAQALGWADSDLYGCDDQRPFARIDKAGLLWLLNGDRLVAITADTATIETKAGARQTYRRKMIAAAPTERRCEWFIPTDAEPRLRHCGRPTGGLQWCAEHLGGAPEGDVA